MALGLTVGANVQVVRSLKEQLHDMAPQPSAQEVNGGNTHLLFQVSNWSRITSWVILDLWLSLQLRCHMDFTGGPWDSIRESHCWEREVHKTEESGLKGRRFGV